MRTASVADKRTPLDVQLCNNCMRTIQLGFKHFIVSRLFSHSLTTGGGLPTAQKCPEATFLWRSEVVSQAFQVVTFHPDIGST